MQIAIERKHTLAHARDRMMGTSDDQRECVDVSSMRRSDDNQY